MNDGVVTCDDLSLFSYSQWVASYWDLVSYCKQKGYVITDVYVDEARLRKIHSQFLGMVEAGYDPFYISAKVMKDIVGGPLYGEKGNITFGDGNRRMGLKYAMTILRICGYRMNITDKEALNLKEKVRFMELSEVETFLRTHCMASKAESYSSCSSSDSRESHKSNSSCVIEHHKDAADINNLRAHDAAERWYVTDMDRQHVTVHPTKHDAMRTLSGGKSHRDREGFYTYTDTEGRTHYVVRSDVAPHVGFGDILTTRLGNDFFRPDTGLPMHEAMVKHREYFAREKGRNTMVVHMTPDEYMDAVKAGFGPDYMIGVEDSLWKKYAAAMLRGDKFDMPYLYYNVRDGRVTFAQEGRHRALAARQAGASTIPVFIEYPSYRSEFEIATSKMSPAVVGAIGTPTFQDVEAAPDALPADAVPCEYDAGKHGILKGHHWPMGKVLYHRTHIRHLGAILRDGIKPSDSGVSLSVSEVQTFGGSVRLVIDPSKVPGLKPMCYVNKDQRPAHGAFLGEEYEASIEAGVPLGPNSQSAKHGLQDIMFEDEAEWYTLETVGPESIMAVEYWLSWDADDSNVSCKTKGSHYIIATAWHGRNLEMYQDAIKQVRDMALGAGKPFSVHSHFTEMVIKSGWSDKYPEDWNVIELNGDNLGRLARGEEPVVVHKLPREECHEPEPAYARVRESVPDAVVSQTPIDSIKHKGKLLGQSSEDTIVELMEAIKSGDNIPPILIHDGYLQDGRHRLEAYRRLGYTTVPTIEGYDPGAESVKVNGRELELEMRDYMGQRYKAEPYPNNIHPLSKWMFIHDKIERAMWDQDDVDRLMRETIGGLREEGHVEIANEMMAFLENKDDALYDRWNDAVNALHRWLAREGVEDIYDESAPDSADLRTFHDRAAELAAAGQYDEAHRVLLEAAGHMDPAEAEHLKNCFDATANRMTLALQVDEAIHYLHNILQGGFGDYWGNREHSDTVDPYHVRDTEETAPDSLPCSVCGSAVAAELPYRVMPTSKSPMTNNILQILDSPAWKHQSVRDINFAGGGCDAFAHDVAHLGLGKVVWLDDMPGYESIDHAALYYEGLYYDAINVDGVMNPSDLYVVREQRRHMHEKAPDAFSEAEMLAGMKVESEHTDDPLEQLRIAKDHLREIPDYYSRLIPMEAAALAGAPSPGPLTAPAAPPKALREAKAIAELIKL